MVAPAVTRKRAPIPQSNVSSRTRKYCRLIFRYRNASQLWPSSLEAMNHSHYNTFSSCFCSWSLFAPSIGDPINNASSLQQKVLKILRSLIPICVLTTYKKKSKFRNQLHLNWAEWCVWECELAWSLQFFSSSSENLCHQRLTASNIC